MFKSYKLKGIAHKIIDAGTKRSCFGCPNCLLSDRKLKIEAFGEEANKRCFTLKRNTNSGSCIVLNLYAFARACLYSENELVTAEKKKGKT